MSSHRLRSTLYHSTSKPATRPAPLWQAAAALDPAARRHEGVGSRHRRDSAGPGEDFSARQSAILHARDTDDWRRAALVSLVVCTGMFAAGVALWQAREARVVYVPIPREAATASMTIAPMHPAPAVAMAPAAPAVYQAPLATNDAVAGSQAAYASRAVAAPAMPLTWTPPPAYPMPTPVDYAARDRQIADLKRQMDALDETVRRVRADPHWYGLIKGSTDTSRQQASDSYLKELDRQRDDLRRRKWALEGR